MASITSLSNSSASSIYGTRNILSGLASGMDTESMIENAISGIKLKISALEQKRTKVEWKQEAYRSIIDKMANFTQKYTSYASSTNLLSNSFFNSAVRTSAAGKYAEKVTASGKTSSDVQLLGVRQMATAATYKVNSLGGGAASGAGAVTGSQVDLAETLPQSTITGSMTLKYGGSRTIDLEFGELDIYRTPEELADGIREQLKEISVTTSSGEQKKASEIVDVKVQGGSIVFGDAQNAGNSVIISSASGKLKDTLGINTKDKPSQIQLAGKTMWDDTATLGEYLNDKSLNVNLDGVSKTIDLPKYEKGQSAKDYLSKLQENVDKAFGKGKLQVSGGDNSEGGKFTFTMKPAQAGSTLNVSGTAAKAIGLPKNGQSSYLEVSKSLGELLGDKWSEVERNGEIIAAEGDVREVKDKNGNVIYHVDETGARVKQTYDGKWFQADSEGEFLYEVKVNDVSVGKFSKNSSLESVMNAINSNADAGVKVSYSKVSDQFQFTANDTGANGRIEFDGVSRALFGAGGNADSASTGDADGVGFTAGKDAILSMKVNGTQYTDITRSNNSFEVDGLTINLKGEFGYTDKTGDDGTVVKELDKDSEPVTFSTTSDSDKIVDAIKSMVEDYNAMVTEIKNAYSTQPATKNGKANGNRYEPLTDEDKATMSDSAIEAYEEKAKQGLLFADSNLSGLYSKLRSAIVPGGADGQTLREIGISTSYSGGLTTLTLDEKALRDALESDPDKVRNAFTKSKESGSSSNGLMQSLLQPLNTYAKTTGEPKGILITHAGSIKAPNSLNSNTLKRQMDTIDKQIERWEDKMSDQIDRYTTKFSKLEQLIAQMNSQSSALMGLMGNSGY